MLHSIYDLTTSCKKTTGDVPAKLVGASTTVVGSKMYLFGGRLVAERRMVSDLYVFDLESSVWERIPSHPEDEIPRARYFHSADAWNNQLIIFGGMSNQPESSNPDELCVLNDVRFFDLTTRRWLPVPQTPTTSDHLVPRARYAHLSAITADRLFIIGGQDFYNTWLDDVCVYDLLGKAWVLRREYDRHCGTYRSVAVSSNLCVRFPLEDRRPSSPSVLGPPGARFREDKIPDPDVEAASPESLQHLPYSTLPTEDHPADIYLYSNYNFTDVKRELEVFSPLPDTDFTMQDRSATMGGTNFPPGLRFPTGAILGTHLIIAGTYLAHSYQSFSIWVLDLVSMNWSRIDPGKAVETGSWFRGCLWAEANKFMVFGNRNGNLVEDYNRRLLSWDHVAVVDLEAFGIYQPPPLKLDLNMQELGLAALEEKVLADFEIACDDDRRIPCSRKILEDRWPWFKDQRRKMLETALLTMENLPSSPMHVPLSELPGSISDEQRPDPRLSPRTFFLSEPYPITLALLQYFYSLSLITPLQHAPAVLSQLLVLATNYQITHLEALVKHAMHRALSNSTSVGVYEVATLCSCRSLQIRALKTVMSYTQKRPTRTRNDKDGSGGRPPDGTSGGGGSSGGTEKYVSRPRGTSDARWRTTVDTGRSNYNYTSRSTMGYSAAVAEPHSPVHHLSPLRRHDPLSTTDQCDHELRSMADLLNGTYTMETPSIPGGRNRFSQTSIPESDSDSISHYRPVDVIDIDEEHFHLSQSRRPHLNPIRTSGVSFNYRDSDTPSLVSTESLSSWRSSAQSHYFSPATPNRPRSAVESLSIIKEDYDASPRIYGDMQAGAVASRESLDMILQSPPPKPAIKVSNATQMLVKRAGSLRLSLLSPKSKTTSTETMASTRSSLDMEPSKEERKMHKKEEVKARREQLAEELKQRPQVATRRASGRRKRPEIVSMFGDPRVFTF